MIKIRLSYSPHEKMDIGSGLYKEKMLFKTRLFSIYRANFRLESNNEKYDHSFFIININKKRED